MDPLISIIVPVYNSLPYLEEAFNSLFDQTYSNLEIIAVDDGSTDGSSQMLDKLSLCDNRMLVFHRRNQGVSDARNFGLSISKGEYVSFLDSDDYCDREYIQTLYKNICNFEVPIATCHYSIVDNNGNINTVDRNSDLVVVPYRTYDFLANYSHFVVWGTLFKKSVIENLRFSDKYKVGEDTLFFAEALKCAGVLADTPEPLYYYRNLEHSLSKGEYNSNHFSVIEAWDTIIDLFHDQDYSIWKSCFALRAINVLNGVYHDILYNGLNSTFSSDLLKYARKDIVVVLKSNLSKYNKARLLFYSLMPHLYLLFYYLKIQL